MSTTKKTITTVRRNPKKVKKNNKRRKAVLTAPQHSAVYIAPCTRLYAKALVNPFAVQGLPCIPDNVVLPSFKFMTRARGVFSTGTAGAGFIIMDPFQMLVNNGSLIPDPVVPRFGGAIYYTDKTYTQTDMHPTISTALTTGVNIQNPNSLFSLGDFDVQANHISQSRQFRLVACGLRIKYIGSNLYNGGRLVIFRNQGNSSFTMNDSYTGNDLMLDPYSAMTTVTRSDRYVYYVPDDPAYIAYNQYNDFAPNLVKSDTGEPPEPHYSMGIFIDGGQVTPNQQSWEFEAVAFFETVGKSFTLSKSEGDPVGHDLVLSSLPNTAPATPPQQVESSVLSSFLKGFGETTREVAYNVGRNTLGYAASAAMRYANPNPVYPRITN